MKRILAAMIAFVLVLAIPFASVEAAGNSEKGELLITQEPETTEGAVGEIVKVNFFLYPNLPDGRKLDSFQCTMKYDQSFVTLGAINQVDDEKNLTSLMKSKGPLFQYNIDQENGLLILGFIDMYGVESEGFWFQAEFRIEQEGATAFVFNNFEYTGIIGNGDYTAARYMIDPVSVGGLYTAGYEVPTDGAAGETFAPLTPAMETPVTVTPTPKPENNGQPVPVTSTLPTYSSVPTASGIVTPAPAVTSMPVTTPAPYESTSAPQTETAEPVQTDPTLPAGETTAAPIGTPESGDPAIEAEASAFPIGGDEIVGEATTAPNTQTAPVGETSADPEATKSGSANDQKDDSDKWLIIGIIAGMVAVVGLGALAIVLLLKRRKMNDQ